MHPPSKHGAIAQPNYYFKYNHIIYHSITILEVSSYEVSLCHTFSNSTAGLLAPANRVLATSRQPRMHASEKRPTIAKIHNTFGNTTEEPTKHNQACVLAMSQQTRASTAFPTTAVPGTRITRLRTASALSINTQVWHSQGCTGYAYSCPPRHVLAMHNGKTTYRAFYHTVPTRERTIRKM